MPQNSGLGRRVASTIYEEDSLSSLIKVADNDGDGSASLQELIAAQDHADAGEHHYHFEGWVAGLEL